MEYPLFSDIPVAPVTEIDMSEAEWELLRLEILLGGG